MTKQTTIVVTGSLRVKFFGCLYLPQKVGCWTEGQLLISETVQFASTSWKAPHKGPDKVFIQKTNFVIF